MQPVEEVEVEGVDYGWVMQTTFVVTILIGAPAVAVLSAFVTLDTWGARAAFAIRVGAPIWFVTAVVVALYAKRSDGQQATIDIDGNRSGRDETDSDETDSNETDSDETDSDGTDSDETDSDETDSGASGRDEADSGREKVDRK